MSKWLVDSAYNKELLAFRCLIKHHCVNIKPLYLLCICKTEKYFVETVSVLKQYLFFECLIEMFIRL